MSDSSPPSRSSWRRVVLLHHAEVGLKGGNRSQFERRLSDRVRQGLEHAGIPPRVERLGSRYVVGLPPGDPEGFLDRAVRVLRRIPGVANVLPSFEIPSEIEVIRDAAAEALAEAPPGSFKIETRRADKQFPMESIAVSRDVAPFCLARSPRPVDVHDPDVTIRIEITKQRTFVSGRRLPGPGGLPVGSGVRLLSFVSGGIDSAVATWTMIRRGARVSVVHFHNRTHEGARVLEKLEDVCGVLAWSAGTMRLLVVPFEACQRAIVAAVPAPYRMVVYRRAMFRIGARLARQERALGFVTGDSFGQVASQTGENLMAIHAAATLPVYAPLIGSDKAEIVHLARRIGTYEISIRPHEDCCSFLAPPHPVTASRLEDVLQMEGALPWDALVAEALEKTDRRTIPPDPGRL